MSTIKLPEKNNVSQNWDEKAAGPRTQSLGYVAQSSQQSEQDKSCHVLTGTPRPRAFSHWEYGEATVNIG